ncbi:MAG: GTP cyclohydrolase II [Candidatus Margulisbacteria bacterium]|nr:GTP cyclohydrolase II [Candidatus Margulisiibacteriota bacterium]
MIKNKILAITDNTTGNIKKLLSSLKDITAQQNSIKKELLVLRHHHYKANHGSSILFPILMSPVSTLDTKYGPFFWRTFLDPITNDEFMAVYLGKNLDAVGRFIKGENIPVRPHSACLTGDVFHSLWCECGPQKDEALEIIVREHQGVLIYLPQEGRGIGLYKKGIAYWLQRNRGLDTIEADRRLGFSKDLRHYEVAAQILYKLGIKNIRIISNSADKARKLAKYGISVTDHIPLVSELGPGNFQYLLARALKSDYLIFKNLRRFQIAHIQNEVIKNLNDFQRKLIIDLLGENNIGDNIDPKLIEVFKTEKLME